MFKFNYHLLDINYFYLFFRYIFTADPRGALKLWRLADHVSASQNGKNYNPSLVAEYISCFGLRIMCLDVSCEEEVLPLF